MYAVTLGMAGISFTIPTYTVVIECISNFNLGLVRGRNSSGYTTATKADKRIGQV